MKELGSRQTESEIARYLYGELAEAERAAFEDKFFDDDALFYAVATRENELVDRYAGGKLAGVELERFARALESLPALRAKVANAAALQTFIAEEKSSEKTVAVAAFKETFGQKLARHFSMKNPAFGYAMAALLAVFALSSVFLLIDNSRKSDELASLQNAPPDNLRQKEIELESRAKESQTRENELKNQIDDERRTSGDLVDELERERRKRAQTETEIERLRRDKNAARQAITPPTKETEPIIASISLAPDAAANVGKAAQNLSIGRGTKRVAVCLALPENAKTDERFSVVMNEKIVAEDLAALTANNGQKAVRLTVSPNDLREGANKFVVRNAAGADVSSYVFGSRKK